MNATGWVIERHDGKFYAAPGWAYQAHNATVYGLKAEAMDAALDICAKSAIKGMTLTYKTRQVNIDDEGRITLAAVAA